MTRMHATRRSAPLRLGMRWTALAALTAAMLLSGCRESEQDRILNYEKGVYQGKVDQPITEEQWRALKQRAHRQSF